jgi:DMSO/TMAO reductase YedYZ molybdopterin-dependent catalytic subunit
MHELTSAMLPVLRSLPERTVTVPGVRDSQSQTFRGALLYDYGRAIGLRPNPPSRGFGNYYYAVTAEDGFTVAFAYFEVTPRATDKQVLLAFEVDGAPLPDGVRLVVPGDGRSGRSVSGVVNVQLRTVPPVTPIGSIAPADGLTLRGLLRQPKRLTVDDFSRYARHEVVTATPRHGGVPVAPRRYGGALLWDLLDDAGLVADPAIDEDILRRIVVATSADGSVAVVAVGEIEPRFMAGHALVATSVDGQPLPPDQGPFRLVAPYDKVVGRALKRLRSLEVRQA